ncbi:hypothetical protein CgunFtcFv8_020714 [Champsocephalus gunnari]|uniref:Uncharacterized protein n=1 Tax=Champsocephalus gunnari TaxID=52237 RepID=A0AAN8E5X3_CHAGU|nr:hypothetical protein CgunFtcFv8_020714 [Champsocephalus gunnari]
MHPTLTQKKKSLWRKRKLPKLHPDRPASVRYLLLCCIIPVETQSHLHAMRVDQLLDSLWCCSSRISSRHYQGKRKMQIVSLVESSWQLQKAE